MSRLEYNSGGIEVYEKEIKELFLVNEGYDLLEKTYLLV
jgi:hypothetical protein